MNIIQAVELVGRQSGHGVQVDTVATVSSRNEKYVIDVQLVGEPLSLDDIKKKAIGMVGREIADESLHTSHIAYHTDMPISVGINAAGRVAYLRAAAIEIVQSSGVDVTEPVKILPLAQQLVKCAGCTLKTAKIRIAEAVRRMRHPDWQPPERGGARPGAGRPPAE